MKNYEKPVIVVDDAVSEGVYAASGSAAGNDCYTVTAYITQTPQVGRGDYRIHVNATHAASDSHHSGEQVLTLSFNQPVTYSSSGGTLIGGDGTSSISIRYNYHNNGNDNIGLSDIIVVSDPELQITGYVMTCNHDCGQH